MKDKAVEMVLQSEDSLQRKYSRVNEDDDYVIYAELEPNTEWGYFN